MHVAVTGASSGIGEAIAREYARAGASVTLVARRKELLDKLVGELGAKSRAVAWDLGDPDRACDWVEAAEKDLGPIDVMINNAGLDNAAPTLTSDPALMEKILRLNLHTPIRLSCFVMKRMLDAKRTGTIVNVASVAGFAAPPMQTFYGASKAGLAMFSETLRSEHRNTSVNVLTVYPGPVTTVMSDAAYEAYGGRKGAAAIAPEGKTDVLARKIRRAVEKRRARVIYPAFYAITRYVPAIAIWVTGKMVDGTGRPPKST